MYEVIQGAISAGGYRLAQMEGKIKKLFLLGDLTEDQTDALLTLAANGVSADAERPGNLTLIQTLAARLAALEERICRLEGGSAPQTEYPQWKPWDGISPDYPEGALVFHKGQLWRSLFPGQNVWEPGTPGLWETAAEGTEARP